MPKKVLIIAGEASSDLHGSNLIRAMKTLEPDIEFFGLGGPLMKAQGADIKFDIVSRAIIGILEVFKHIGYFRNIYRLMRELLDKDKPDLAILIDYPGFNLRFAGELKKRNIPVIYYISPQIWAWGKNRIRTIKRLVNKMLVIFKFEKELYDSCGVDCEFVGHPLLDIVRPLKDKGIFKRALSMEGDFPVIGIMPGSRENEIRRILPVMLESARLIKNNISSAHFILIKASTVAGSLIDKIIEKYSNGLNIRICENDKYDLLNIMDIALVCSGTATLETGIMKKPMIVIYKVGFFSWLLSKSLVKIPNIALVNVVGAKKIVPELIQFKARPSLIAREAVGILKDPKRASDMENALAAVKELLLPYGASERAARVIVGCLKYAHN